VEDWFHVENFKNSIPYSTWSSCEFRVEKNTNKLLDLFDSVKPTGKPKARGQNAKNKSFYKTLFNVRKADFIATNNKPLTTESEHRKTVKATFFVLGWVAQQVPHLVREIYDRGHEIASHGFYHEISSQQSHKNLQVDLSDSRKLLEDIIGEPVYGYRAPNFAINDDILKIVEEAGYQYDSSYNSFSMHGRYGYLNLSQQKKYGIAAKISDAFWELPISNIEIMKNIIPWGGGAYFRLLPFKLFRLGVHSILGKQNAYVFYLHPWELDPQQPRVKDIPVFNKFRHYYNLHKTALNLISLIQSFKGLSFLTCSQYLKMIKSAGFTES
jgi:polysaccharide deacetylase family protein (PEP-CTERM system associated)